MAYEKRINSAQIKGKTYNVLEMGELNFGGYVQEVQEGLITNPIGTMSKPMRSKFPITIEATMEEYQIIVDDKNGFDVIFTFASGETAIMTDAIHIGEFSAKMPDEAGKLELTSAYKVEIQKDPNG